MFSITFCTFRILTPTNYASAAIFGNRIGDGKRSGWKEARKTKVGTQAGLWYPDYIYEQRYPMPGARSGKQWLNILRTLKRQRKGLLPVKKGEGKRNTKGKKGVASSKKDKSEE